MRFSVTIYSEGCSFQDLRGKVTFEWSNEEISGLPKGVRSAIETIVCDDSHIFKQNKEYVFSRDKKSRLCLMITETEKAGRGESLSTALLNVWKYHLKKISDSVSDEIRSHPDCQDFGSKRIFLNRMRLVDALLRVNFYTNDFWIHRSNWNRQDFYRELIS